MRGAGRRRPTDWKHYEKFPLTMETRPTYAPVIWGVNWYNTFDNPIKMNDEWWIGLDGDLGYIAGGHAIAQPYYGAGDTASWYMNYDQGQQGACVGYSFSRAQSWLNRRYYHAEWLWHEARLIDEWDDNDDLTDPDHGTSLRAGAEILRTKGHRRIYQDRTLEPSEKHGISAYRWISNVDQVLDIVGGEQKRRGAITWRNSWGIYYPQKVWLSGEVAQRLLEEDGEAVVYTDK